MRIPYAFALASLLAAAGCSDEVDQEKSASAAGSASSASSSGGGGSTGASTASSGGGASGGAGGSIGPHPHVTVQAASPAGVPAAGEPIVVNDASGAIITTTTLDANGEAEVVVPAGGLVAIYPSQKGERVEMQGVVDPPDQSTVHFLVHRIVPPTQPPTTQFDVVASGYPSATATLSVYRCRAPSTVPADPSGTTETIATSGDKAGCGADDDRVLVVASDAAMNPLAWGQVENLPYGNTAPVAVSLDQTSFVELGLTLEGLDPSITSGDLSFVDEGSPSLLSLTFEPSLPPSEVMTSVLFPDAGLWIATTGFFDYKSNGYSRRVTLFDAEAPPANVDLDMSVLAGMDLEPPDVTDPVHPTLAWTTDPGSEGIATRVELSSNQRTFTVTAPSGGITSFRMPDIPPALTKYAPDAPDALSWLANVSFVDEGPSTTWATYQLFTGYAPAGYPVDIESVGVSWE